ncbi:MAG: amidase [Alphaproteobacteria bacterium]|nr:amidase [Alphaproteobacteria bacterium]
MPHNDELIRLTAREAVAALRRGEVTPAELVAASAARIAAVDGPVNAMPTLCIERAQKAARSLKAPDQPGPGWLGGLPLAVKDLNDVAGVRTTYGSPIFADHVPARSSYEVLRLEANGALVIGKSNTPEFGAGANTFNEVFGKTRNPWNTALTCAGSSGGSAVALATGMVWLATGSDLAGSLRTPASFCSVVGLRPTPGRVAHGPIEMSFQTLAVDGPMGRTVGDVALMLDAMAGFVPEDPLTFEAPAVSFQAAVDAPVAPRKVAFSPNFGIGPVDPEVAAVCEAAARRFAEAGAVVDVACPDMSDARETFQTLRAALFAGSRARFFESHRHLYKPEMVWNIEKGLALTQDDIGRAERRRGEYYRRVVAFLGEWNILASPAAIVPPFDVDTRWVQRVGDHVFDNYVDWMYIAYAVTLAACPAISVPCGFTKSGLPVGLQLVAPPRGEAALLGAARVLEQMTGLERGVPIDPRAPAARAVA